MVHLGLPGCPPRHALMTHVTMFGARLRRCCADINATLDVAGLCRSFPARVQKLLDSEGGRLKE